LNFLQDHYFLKFICGIWRTFPFLAEETCPLWLCCKVNGTYSSRIMCSISSSTLQQVWVKHKSLLACGCASCAVT
jgi:hypothetical protein